MKKTILIFCIFSLFLTCGFAKKEKPYLLMSAASINKENVKRIETVFGVSQRINYAIVAPDGLKYEGVRLQISKQDDKTSNWGFSIIQTKDLYLSKSKNSMYSDYIYITRPGRYILQFFYLNNKDYPFLHREFIVQ